MVTVSYNNQNNATIYKYTTSWVLATTYITGSLIVQNTITADKLSVNSLSAISANLGTVTAGTLTAGTTFAGALSAATGTFSGTLTVGSSPAISGSTMTGAGAVINTNGTFALGNSSQNLTYNGSTIKLNGFANSTTNTSSNIAIGPGGANVLVLSGSGVAGTGLVTISGYLNVQPTTTTVPTSFSSGITAYTTGSASLPTTPLVEIWAAPALLKGSANAYILSVPFTMSFLATFSSTAAYQIIMNILRLNFYDSETNLISISSYGASVSHNSVLFQPLLS